MGAPNITEKTEGRELLELEVDEVSLVDRGAIRRTFSVVKALTEIEGMNRLDHEGEVDVKKKPTEIAKAEGADTETPIAKVGEIDVETQKATAPLLSAIASERLGLIGSKIGELQAGLGTMTKADASTALYSLHDLIWSAERDVCAVSKSMGIEPPAVPADAVERIEKAHPRKMTSRRLSEFKALAEKFTGLLKEFEAETEDPEEDPMGTAATTKSEGAAPTTTTPAPDVAALVTEAVTKALKPIEDRLAAVEAKPATETKVEKAVEKTPETKPDAAPAWAVDLKKSLEAVGQRLDVIEGTSNAAGGNRTETLQKGEKSPSVWGGIVD